jgi:hypothetical protein
VCACACVCAGLGIRKMGGMVGQGDVKVTGEQERGRVR